MVAFYSFYTSRKSTGEILKMAAGSEGARCTWPQQRASPEILFVDLVLCV